MKDKFYMCECGCGALHVSYEPGWGLELALFERSPSRSLWNRIRLAWSALRGNPYADMVILNDQQIADLVDQLVEIQNQKEYKL